MGVGGRTAPVVGEKLWGVARAGHQVLCVTHMRIVTPGPADRLAGLAHRFAGYGTGIDQDGIVEPGLFSLRLHHFGFICVEAAAEGNDLDTAHCASASRVPSRDQRPVEGSSLPDHSHSAGPVMALKIRLARGGSKKRPYYHVVLADARSPRDGRFLENLGSWNPMLAKDDEKRVQLNAERIKHWIENGAQPTDRVLRFLDEAGVAKRETKNNPIKAKPGKRAQERAAEKAQKVADAAAAAADAAE